MRVAFIAAAAMFGQFYHNWLPVIFSIPVLLFVSAYPLLKRFTRLCHYYLGAALALAPICAWIAIAGDIQWPPVLMALAVVSWTAGFDIIYACQDYESDLQTGVVSVPAKVGIAKAAVDQPGDASVFVGDAGDAWRRGAAIALALFCWCRVCGSVDGD